MAENLDLDALERVAAIDPSMITRGELTALIARIRELERAASPADQGDDARADTERLDYLDRHAVVAKPGQPIRAAIDAAMGKEGNGNG